MKTLKTDYLIIGSGAVGMAFADELLLQSDDTDIIIVDRFAKPGGHWNNAYPFVTLHQPSQFYGVSSKELSQGLRDQVGLNKGLGDLASGSAILAYFDDVMRHTFLPSGRVRYFPLCSVEGEIDSAQTQNGLVEFRHCLNGDIYQVQAEKIVDATYLKTTVPSTHTPNFTYDEDVRFMPLNDVPKIDTPPEGFVVIGGGKTGIDCVLFLLENHVDPDKITWVKSRDGWLLNRENTQPSEDFFFNTMEAQAAQFEAIAAATDKDNMFDRLNECGYFLRFDPEVRPTMFHGATVSPLELEELRRVKNVVRLGRIEHISSDTITLNKGAIPTSPQHIHLDCSASAISNLEIKPIFNGRLITPQTVRSYQPVFSAAFIAMVESSYGEDAEKNKFCGVVPLPNGEDDFMRLTAAFMMNQYTWGQTPLIRDWLFNNRLDGFSRMVAGIKPEDAEKKAVMKRLKHNAMPAAMKLNQLIAALD
ncbi:hypothetical protein DES40_2497 [Litorimonas taeanensis]|uniref:NAD(P)-binding protein n=1 Tax=Litorimonas taeanensis TaxID=568099 RepID=A0A420WFD9_9PROT|nr:NAD(P)/FAD-dependent oxidoreductase [Litorimonas taeanensis]RKQ69693.1 hypothetical protein DES40_2497 [Litorimonas taeanensis]